jgi:excisionase family DNA binding protein
MDIIAKLKSTDHALTVNELAALLQVHDVTIQRWAKGIIPSFRIGGEAGAGEYRFNPQDIATYIESNRRTHNCSTNENHH